MKNANGTGSISKLNRKNLRKPYMVRITQNGKRTTLGYYSTQKEAQEALALYNAGNTKNNLDYKNLTFAQAWQMFLDDKNTNNLSDSTLRGYNFGYALVKDSVRNKKVMEITLHDLQQNCNELANNGKGYHTLRKFRSICSMVYEYLNKNNITNVNPTQYLDIGKSPRKGEALVFTDDEIDKLWIAYNKERTQKTKEALMIILMLMYNGCRISEFLNLKSEDVHIKERYIEIKNAKTEAGDRKIPIHEGMVNFYEYFLNYENQFLITFEKYEGNGKHKRRKYTYANFRDSYWDQIIDLLNLNENLTPHNCRKTFSTLLKRYGVDMTYQKLILGHTGALTLTEKTYTYVDIKQLVEAVNKIPIKPY